MNDIIKWVGKIVLHGVFWIFFLSIRFDGRTLYSYGHDSLVQNNFVQAIDEELADLWFKLSETAEVTFKKKGENQQEETF